MASKLSTDILSMIFEEFELEEENSTLYSCIFVKREWCQVAVPFLWKNPWKNFEHQRKVNQYIMLFNCFLLMMPNESKEFLKMNGINFFIKNTSQNNSSLQIPLFNYASFCKVIDSSQINIMVNNNIKDQNNRLSDYQQYLIEQEILKLLISNTSKLITLKLHHKSHPVAFFPNSFISLSRLNELHCHTSIDATIFYGLSQLCRNIERLVIVGHDDDNYGLILFIEQQIHLKRVKMFATFNYDEYFAQGKCKNLGEALATKSSSIIELDLGDEIITMPPILLKKFQNNLTIFKFNIYYDITERRLADELENVLEDISLPNLQQLIINEFYCPPFDIMAKVIEKTNGQLKKIDLGTHVCNAESIDVVVSSIAKHCPKLELLAIWVNDCDKMIELFKECKNLRGLVLQPVYTKQNIVELFKALYNNASNLLRKLELYDSWEFSEETLNDFFENWNQQQRNPLDFYTCFDKLKDEYKDIIKKYQRLGVIRKFDDYIKPHDWLCD